MMTKIILPLMLALTVASLASAQQTDMQSAPGTLAQQPSSSQGQIQRTETAPDSRLGKVGDALLVFLVLSVIFEVALTPIFNWRVFLARFDKKGIKTPITVILALSVFWTYDLDIFRDVLVALDYQAPLTFGGQFVTALLIAGGSDGVFRIFTKLGLRDPVAREKKAQEAQAALAATKKAPAKS